MSMVIWHVTMSLDGFITGPDDSMEWAFEYGESGSIADKGHGDDWCDSSLAEDGMTLRPNGTTV
jgi:hypothetical protein